MSDRLVPPDYVANRRAQNKMLVFASALAAASTVCMVVGLSTLPEKSALDLSDFYCTPKCPPALAYCNLAAPKP